VEDQTEQGSRCRILTLLDESTRECLAVHVGWSIRALDVTTVLLVQLKRNATPNLHRPIGEIGSRKAVSDVH
jgi:putative transposase